jgi:hypothetical protein
MTDKIRVRGHGLISEGAPYDADGQRIWVHGLGHGGAGRGKCSCGALSPGLSSQPQRRQWHDQHKRDIAEARATDGSAP